jgi:hypothetical protein
MKWLTRFFRNFFCTHILYEEKYDPYTLSVPSAADVQVLRASVVRYFSYLQPGQVYILLYEPMYDNAIDGLREDGWNVVLQVTTTGELYYAIYSKSVEATVPRF